MRYKLQDKIIIIKNHSYIMNVKLIPNTRPEITKFTEDKSYVL